MIKEDWRKELQQLKLSEKAKHNIVQQTYKGKTALTYKIVFPSFLILAIVWFLLPTNLNMQQIVTGDGIQPEMDHANYFRELFWWMFGSNFLWMVAIVQLHLLLMLTPRYEKNLVVMKYRVFMNRAKKHLGIMLLLIVVLTLFIIILQFGPILFVSSATIYQFYVVLSIVCNYCLLLLWFVRKHQWPICPNCHEPFSKKELNKQMFRMKQTTCEHCEIRLYTTKKSGELSGIAGAFSLCIPLMGWFLVPFWMIIVVCSVYLIFLFTIYFKISLQFSTKEEPIW